MKRFLFDNEQYTSAKLNISLLIMRLFFGLSMAFAHGIKKVPPHTKFIGHLSKLGLPMAEVFAWCAGLAELIGGLLIALGLVTRLSSISWICTMGVAAFVAHGADPYRKKELALMYLVIGLFFFVTGPGRYSLDQLISKKGNK